MLRPPRTLLADPKYSAFWRNVVVCIACVIAVFVMTWLAHSPRVALPVHDTFHASELLSVATLTALKETALRAHGVTQFERACRRALAEHADAWILGAPYFGSMTRVACTREDVMVNLATEPTENARKIRAEMSDALLCGGQDTPFVMESWDDVNAVFYDPHRRELRKQTFHGDAAISLQYMTDIFNGEWPCAGHEYNRSKILIM